MNQLSTNHNCTLSSSVFRMCRPQDMYVEHSLHFALKFPVVSLGNSK